jgi:hypothetical protein
MMTSKGLLAAVGLLVVLGGLVFWAQKHPKSPDTPTPLQPKILTLNASDITAVRLTKAATPPIEFKKLGDKWQITEPSVMPADQDVTNGIVNAVATLNAERMIDEKPTDLKEYGLVSPPLEVDVTMKDGKVNKVLLGSDNPSNTGTYVKVESDPKLYTINSYTKASFDKSLNDLRDRRMMTFDKDKVTTVNVAAKGPAFEFARANNEWQITKPRPLRADSLSVDDLIRKLTEVRMDLTGDQKDVPAGFASGTKVAVATVNSPAGPQTLEVRKGKDNYYAKSSATEGVYKISKDAADGLDKSVDDFRNKKLFDFAFNDPTKVEINGKSYEKSGENWNSGPDKFDGGSVQSVIDKLRDLSAAKFAEKSSGTQALALAVTYGEKKTVERVTINKSGEEYLATREGDATSAYIIDKAAFEDLQKAIAGIKPAAPPAPAAKKK